jgi:signal transduction histidine kinase
MSVVPDLSRLVALLPFPAWLLDPDGHARGNAAARAMDGRDGATVYELWRQADGSPLAPGDSPVDQSLLRGETVEATLRPAAGGAALRVAAVPLGEAGVEEAGDAVALLVAERPGPANLADWLGDVGHALRSPLSPIRTAAQLLRNPRIADEQRSNLLEIVERQIRELMGRIDELADLVRLKRGALQAEPRPCDLSMLLDIVRGRVAARFDEEDRELSLPSPPSEVSVLVDQGQCVQAMALVLCHAMRHTPAGEQVACELGMDEDTATLVVPDRDGRASPERARALLEPPVERHGVGLGASLYLAQQLLRLSGGRFEVGVRGDATGMEFRIALRRS